MSAAFELGALADLPLGGPTQTRTRAELEISYPGRDVHIVDRVKRFTYTSDILAVGQPCTFDVEAGKRGDELRAIPIGATLRLWLQNAAVNGGRKTLKHLGIVTQRRASLNAGEIRVTSCDLGWHLANGAAPLFYKLRRAVFGDLVDPKKPHGIIDSSFGLKDVRIDDSNLLQRRLRQGVAEVRAQYGQAFDQLFHVQVEPGDSYYSIIKRYAQRFNRLVTVSCDGYVQVWNPDYDRDPMYRFVSDDQHGNVEDAEVVDDISTIYTESVCVGQIIAKQFATDTNDPNAGLFRGGYKPITPDLPFVHRLTFGDNEVYKGTEDAQQAAQWKYKRGKYDAHYVNVTVPDHFQAGRWYESDQVCTAHFPDLAIQDSRYYVASVTCESAERGDKTTLILRTPGLLTAYYKG